jgi:hypothetical protein
LPSRSRTRRRTAYPRRFLLRSRSRDTRARRDRVEDQRGRGTGKADSGNYGRKVLSPSSEAALMQLEHVASPTNGVRRAPLGPQARAR